MKLDEMVLCYKELLCKYNKELGLQHTRLLCPCIWQEVDEQDRYYKKRIKMKKMLILFLGGSALILSGTMHTTDLYTAVKSGKLEEVKKALSEAKNKTLIKDINQTKVTKELGIVTLPIAKELVKAGLHIAIDQCPICYDEYADTSRIEILPCGHGICAECGKTIREKKKEELKEAKREGMSMYKLHLSLGDITEHTTCPICRTKLSDEQPR